MKITFTGKTAHAASPEQGTAPTLIMGKLFGDLTALGTGTVVDDDFLQATITHAFVGEENFGISPGYGEIWVTLRTLTDGRMNDLMSKAEELSRRAAGEAALVVEISYHQIFHQCFNSPGPTAELRKALDELGVSHSERLDILPMRPGEDFGLFRSVAPSAMFFLGAGENHAGLHNPDYDNPDELIGIGAEIYMKTIRNVTS